MADDQSHLVSNQLQRLIGRRSGCSLPDAQLLEDFVNERDQASFEVLVWRHGTMVINLCRRILRDSHEAEDAFQVTFLVFARKAGSIGKRESVGSWLWKVAYRVALRIRGRLAKRATCAEPLDDLPARETGDDLLWRDLRPVLDEEIDRLPEKYRVPFILCYLEGHTNEEAAQQLGCPKGTILSRLARGRERLRDRLARRGLGLSVGVLAGLLSQNAASAAVPALLVGSSVEAAIPFAAGQAAAGLVSASVASLTEGVLHAMFLTKVKIVTAVLLALAVLGTGVGLVSYRALAGTSDPGQTVALLQEGDRLQQPQGLESFFSAEQEGRRGEERRPAERKAPVFQGRIVEISDDGKTITLEAGGRGEEAKKIPIKLTDKTTIEFGGVLKDVLKKLKVGDRVAVFLQDGSRDTASALHAERQPDLSSKIVAVSADEKVLTLAVPSRERGAPPDKIEIKIIDQTKKGGAGRGGEVKLEAGNLAAVWLVEGSKDTAAAVQASRAPAQAAGVISAVAEDGKTLTVDSKTRSGEVTKTPIKVADSTRLEFVGGEPRDKKFKVGQMVMVWLQEGSTDTAGLVQVNLQRRSPDVVGTISAISADGKMVTLEIRKRGEDSTKTEIKLTDKTEVEFTGTDKAEEKKLTVGYNGAVWLQEGSKDTAAVFQAAKLGVRTR